MGGRFSYQFLLYPKNIYLGYPQFTGLIEVLLNSTTTLILKSSYNIEISIINIKFISAISY